MKQSLKKYCLETMKGLPDLVEQINNFISNYEVSEIIEFEYFQQQMNDSVKTNESVRSVGLRETRTNKITESNFGWKYSVIITVLTEENIERRLS